MAITGVGDIGTTWRSIADIGLAQETKAENDGFGLPTFSATGYWGYEGPANITFGPASFTATGSLNFEAVGSFTPAPASFSGTGDVPFIGTGSFTPAPAILVGTGEETYAGYGQFFPPAASLNGAGLVSIFGVGVFNAAPADFGGTAKQAKPKGGHDTRQMKAYEDFVHMGQVIKGELLGHLAPNELQSPEHLPQPLNLTVETREPDVQPDIQPDLMATLPATWAQVPGVQLPTVRVKSTFVGRGALTPDPASIEAVARNASVNGFGELSGDSVTLAAKGQVDPYYTQRKQEEQLLEQFLLQLVA